HGPHTSHAAFPTRRSSDLTPAHTFRVHARVNAPLVRGATRPNRGPTHRTRGLLRAARLASPLESTAARPRRTISCDRAAIHAAGDRKSTRLNPVTVKSRMP